MTKKKSLPTILGVILLVLGTFFGVFLINSRQIFRLGAEGDTAPKDIRVSNITDTSATISWVTDIESIGFVLWEDNVEQETDQKSYTHSVTINGLKEKTKYSYKINSGGTLFDNQGISWQFTTGSALGLNKNSTLVSGSILTATGQPVKNAIVYANIGGYLFSTLSSNTGNYVFQLGNTRSSDLSSYLQIDMSQTLVEIFVQAGTLGISSAQIFPQSAKPAPPIILGQTHDFKSLAPSNGGGLPEASLDLPEDSEMGSKFSVPDNINEPTAGEIVTLENPTEGESITSTQPEFFGEGPVGTTITIKVESENPVVDSVQIGNGGSWGWTPSEGLAEGVHKITITWKDVTGITRSLTRNFIVQAGEAPAFEASGSASLSPSPSTVPTTTPKATIKAGTPTPTALPTDVPETGSLTPTFALSIMGIAVMIFSLLIWKMAEN